MACTYTWICKRCHRMQRLGYREPRYCPSCIEKKGFGELLILRSYVEELEEELKERIERCTLFVNRIAELIARIRELEEDGRQLHDLIDGRDATIARLRETNIYLALGKDVDEEVIELQARVKELEREHITKWLCAYEDEGCKVLDGLREENAEKDTRIRELEEGLGIYANKENWNEEVYEGPAFEPAEANIPESLWDVDPSWNHPWAIARSLLDKEE